MKKDSASSALPLELVAAVLVFGCTLTIRAWGISTRFQLLGDQIRDWSIALGSFADLPLVGPATHVHGYTIGPAFYWILWAIRVTVGPWFQNLPHAGGIGQAALQSGADALLLVAIWRRTGQVWIALAAIVVIATAPFDLSLSALVWNPVMGSTLAKVATALVLLDWHRGSLARVVITSVVAWSAVHAYTGAVFVTASVFAAALADPLLRRERRVASRNLLVIAVVIAVLQVPYLAHQVAHRFADPAMDAVTGSVARILNGSEQTEFAKSEAGYVRAFDGIEIAPWQFAFTAWVLLAAAVVVAVRYRRDAAMLLTMLLPPLLALVGYAFFLGALDNYYYLSLMPAAVLTIALSVTAMPSARIARGVSIALLIVALAIVPTRLRYAMTLHQMPEYGAIVKASRVIARRGMPVRAIRTDFQLAPTNDPEFVYRILGGRIDHASPWIAVITLKGDVVYRNMGAS
jgi:hypothetical protein